MADTLAVDLLAKLTWNFQEVLDLSTLQDSMSLEYKKSLADGTAVNLADKIWHDKRTLAAGANETLDLNALVTSIFGSNVTINLVKVKALFIVNVLTVAAEDLVVGAAASTPFLGPLGGTTPTQRCEADSYLAWVNRVDGWSTSGANNLKIANAGAASNEYRIVIVGTSA